ncbi:MAG: LacI family transcriptional regulator [Treponema sp.]|jgi:LacI family transcriptional regulator|nr:LacI family transcriptional regulator [Treponema sp.]
MRITIKDIAKMCNVSTATVSRTVNSKKDGVSEKTRKHILDTVRKTGYSPNTIARSMVTRRTNTIALIVPDICNPFFAELARGVGDACSELGYHLFLCNTDGSPEQEHGQVMLLHDRLVDGMILTTQNIVEDNSDIFKFIKEGYPFVLIERYMTGVNIPLQINIDNCGGIKDAVSYLAGKGHRKIAFIRGPREAANARLRFDGYRKGLARHKLDYDPSLVVWGDYKMQSGYSCTTELLAKAGGEFTAIIGSNDLMTAGACSAILDQKLRIPQDISVVGFDNIPLTGMIYPRITTVGVSINGLGRTAAELLSKWISGSRDIRHILMPCELTERDSVSSI